MTPRPVAHPAGLCGVCEHARVVENRRGSRFWLCRLAGVRPGFRKYPPLPVLACPGFRDGRPEEGSEEGSDGTSNEPSEDNGEGGGA